jgi:hypothetical protein
MFVHRMIAMPNDVANTNNIHLLNTSDHTAVSILPSTIEELEQQSLLKETKLAPDLQSVVSSINISVSKLNQMTHPVFVCGVLAVGLLLLAIFLHTATLMILCGAFTLITLGFAAAWLLMLMNVFNSIALLQLQCNRIDQYLQQQFRMITVTLHYLNNCTEKNRNVAFELHLLRIDYKTLQDWLQKTIEVMKYTDYAETYNKVNVQALIEKVIHHPAFAMIQHDAIKRIITGNLDYKTLPKYLYTPVSRFIKQWNAVAAIIPDGAPAYVFVQYAVHFPRIYTEHEFSTDERAFLSELILNYTNTTWIRNNLHTILTHCDVQTMHALIDHEYAHDERERVLQRALIKLILAELSYYLHKAVAQQPLSLLEALILIMKPKYHEYKHIIDMSAAKTIWHMMTINFFSYISSKLRSIFSTTNSDIQPVYVP